MKENFVAKKSSQNLNNKSDGLKSILISIIFHMVIFIILIVGLPLSYNKLPESKEVVVEVMQIKAKTSLAEKRSEENKKDPEKEVKTSAPVEKPEPKPQPKQQPKQEPKIEPIIIPPLKLEEKKPEAKLIEKPKEKPKDKTPDKKEPPKKDINKSKPKNDSFDSLLKSLEKSVSKKKIENKSNNYSKSQNQDAPKELSISLQDDIKRQLVSCWSPPAGAKDLKDLSVIIEITLAPDGTVTQAKHTNSSLFNNNPYYNSAVNAATRAVWKCSPLKNLPKSDYEAWKVIEFNFDPRDIVY